MNFFPVRRTFIPLPCSAQRAEALLYSSIRKKQEAISVSLGEEAKPIFNGWVKDQKFRISLLIKQPQSFLPLVNGTIASTSKGCLVECKYSLFFSTQLFLAFWSIITAGLTILYTFVDYQPTHAIFAFTLGVGNYVIALSNFDLHFKRTQRHIQSVFNE